jgi:integrase
LSEEIRLKDNTPSWRNAKHRAQWKMTLEVYGKSLMHMPVENIDTPAVLEALKPIWQDKPETASRLRGRIEAVLDAARASGLTPADRLNPARWKGHLDRLLPKPNKLARGNHAAMHYKDVGAFVAKLREREAITSLALEFLILTAARTGEVLGRTGAFVFPGQRLDKPLSGTALVKAQRRMGVHDATVHGFRSSFRDWWGEETNFPREIAEAALAHVTGDKAERAYRRGDALEKRRQLMAEWAVFVGAL